ncbi:MAG TPA: UDP-N-acetylmuramoyl-L-alanyl-D-glutamate--2,6-diaminopimelate ligase, partial [Burkholderiaceae bacterium]|nr:UDP-N-acetylmuramoyl-L-alanyl-D-glutamate--2,6-diaminopimelate ligase [Burkholderiaceae bacterium]
MPNVSPHIAEIVAWLQAIAPATQLSSDSRTIAEGDVFFAYPCDEADGCKYIAHAIEKGAKAVIHEAERFEWDATWAVPHLPVMNLKVAAGPIANAYYGRPDADLFTIAVTGTNGKTSCTQWLGSAISLLGEPTAVIGTLGVGIFTNGEHGEFNATGYTTPDAVLFQRRLAKVRGDGAVALAIEASSIGLDQGRLNGVHFDVALFTNLTRDHLDYHGTMAAYEEAKSRLFDWPGLKHAVVNLDDDMGLRLIRRLQQGDVPAVITGYTLCGRAAEGVAVLKASDIRTSHSGTMFCIESPFGAAQLRVELVGRFNVSNLLGIIGVLLAKGVTWQDAIGTVEALTAVPGRMQQLGGQDAPLVVIDYAHTSDALEKTLASLRQVAEERGGRLWCVFGCGGDRDSGKRAQMGVASLAADQVIVTSDNPRDEEPSAIISQITAGMAENKTPYTEIEDRAAAILWAVRHASKNDVVLLAGKG